MSKITKFLLIPLLFLPTLVLAGQTLKTAGDIGRFLVPGAALGLTLLKQDYTGTQQLVLSAGTSVLLTDRLQAWIRAPKPHPSNSTNSFPSGHATWAFSGAGFLHRRYGWKYAVPAYAVAGLVAYSRVQSRRHHWRDVLAGAGIGVSISFLITDPQHHQINITLNDPLSLQYHQSP